jgi:hypothetical protein
VRVLIAGMTRMLADIITAVVASQADFELVGNLADSAALIAADAVPADVLVVAGPQPPGAVLRLLRGSPALRIITIEPSGHSGAVHTLQLNSTGLGEISPSRLVAAIRGGTSDAAEGELR